MPQFWSQSTADVMTALVFLSVQTVKRHLHHIFGKLEVTTRLSAVARARELGLL